MLALFLLLLGMALAGLMANYSDSDSFGDEDDTQVKGEVVDLSIAKQGSSTKHRLYMLI